MSRQLLIHLSDIHTLSAINWVHLSNNTIIDSGNSPLSEMANIVNNDESGECAEVILALASESLLLSQIHIPGKQARHIKQAAPYIIEENLASNIESMHLAIGSKNHGQYLTAAIEKDLLKQLLQSLQEQGVNPNQIIPDCLLLPYKARTISALIDQERTLIRYGESQGLSIESSNLPTVLSTLLEKNEHNIINIIHSSPLNSEQELLLNTLQAEYSITVDNQHIETPIRLLATQVSDKPAINLYQGEFSPPTRKSKQYANWRPLAKVAAALFCLQIFYYLCSGLYFSWQANNYQNKNIALYKEYFPNVKRIINIKTQTQNHLNQQSNNSDNFLSMLRKVGQGFNDPSEKKLHLQQIRYDKKRQQLILDVLANNLDQLDQLQQKISSHNLSAELLSANEDDKGVRGRLQIQEPQ